MASATNNQLLELDTDAIEFEFIKATLDAIDQAQLEFEFQGFIVETLTAIEVIDEMVRVHTIH